MQKILINDLGYVTGSNRAPTISKIRFWQKSDYRITILCTEKAKSIYEKHLSRITYMSIPYASDASNRLLLIYEYAKRNIIALFYLNKVKNEFDVVYSISAVLDLLLFPFILKYFYK